MDYAGQGSGLLSGARGAVARRAALALSLLSITIGVAGCGSNTAQSSPPPIAIQILVQPANQTIPLGQTATFTVSATGTGTLTYQWSENGTPISGATSASYTTPATVTTDNGSLYTVAVTDPTSSATSSQALLTIGPRSPATGDLRFQQVDAPSVSVQNNSIGEVTNVVIDDFQMVVTDPETIGTPLYLGPAFYDCDLNVTADCSWLYQEMPLPTGQSGLTMIYMGDIYESLNADLASLPTPNSVITSLDIPPGSDAFATAAIETSQTGGFDMRQEIVPPTAIPATATADGLNSRVITAISFDTSGQAHILSYGWQSDTTTLYDVTTLTVAPADVAASATTLAQQGYIITAFGGDDAIGYVLVGTKVQGDTLPRPLFVYTQASGQPSISLLGYAPVGFVDYAGPQDSGEAVTSFTYLYEE